MVKLPAAAMVMEPFEPKVAVAPANALVPLKVAETDAGTLTAPVKVWLV